jgi:hypothetical protein
MVGGGQFTDFVNPDTLALHPHSRVDGELFVRYAQAAALFPMVQFSLAPWRVLAPLHLDAVVAAARLHTRLAPEIMRLARHAAATGEPMLRHMAFVFPHLAGAERIADQFMLGDDVMVAPVLRQGVAWRYVAVPDGAWAPHDGARGWRVMLRGADALASALAAAEQAEEAQQQAAAEPDDDDADGDGKEGTPITVRARACDSATVHRGTRCYIV